MGLNKILGSYGFTAHDSGGGCEWYPRPIMYEGQRAVFAITAEDGCRLPDSLDDRELVGIYDSGTGEELKEAVVVDALKDYLKAL